MSDSSGRWECLALRSLAGNTGLGYQVSATDRSRQRRHAVSSPAGTGRGPPSDSHEGSSLVQRDTRLSEAREKTIHHTEHRGLIDFFLTHPPPYPSASPSGAGLREKDLFTAKSQHMGFGPSRGTPTNQRAKDVGLFRKMGVSCAAFIGLKHRARVPGFSYRPLTPTPTRRLAPRRYGPRAAK